MKSLLKMLLLTILIWQLTAIKTSNVLADSKSILLGLDSTLIADVAEKRIHSIVNISSTKIIKPQHGQQYNPLFNDPFFRHFFGQNFFNIPRERREKSLGSGVIISKDGIVLTNNHVVENAEEILITLADEREMEAKIIGTDPKSDGVRPYERRPYF